MYADADGGGGLISTSFNNLKLKSLDSKDTYIHKYDLYGTYDLVFLDVGIDQ